jgi:hypothetical protein
MGRVGPGQGQYLPLHPAKTGVKGIAAIFLIQVNAKHWTMR